MDKMDKNYLSVNNLRFTWIYSFVFGKQRRMTRKRYSPASRLSKMFVVVVVIRKEETHVCYLRRAISVDYHYEENLDQYLTISRNQQQASFRFLIGISTFDPRLLVYNRVLESLYHNIGLR